VAWSVAHVQLCVCTTQGLQENTGSAICGSLIAPVDFALFLGFYSYMEFVHVRVCVCLCACVCVMCVHVCFIFGKMRLYVRLCCDYVVPSPEWVYFAVLRPSVMTYCNASLVAIPSPELCHELPVWLLFPELCQFGCYSLT
jgi:hypothetical protein